MIDGYELFRPSEQEVYDAYSAIIRDVISGERVQERSDIPPSSTLLESLSGRYSDLTQDTRQPIPKIQLADEKKGYILTDGAGVLVSEGDEVLVPALFNCTCFMAILETDDPNNRLFLHSNYLYNPELFAQALAATIRVKGIAFFTNGKIDDKTIDAMSGEIETLTGIDTQGYEISSFFGLPARLDSASLLFSKDTVSLLRFSDRQISSAEGVDPILDLQESPEDLVTRSVPAF